MRFGEFLDLIDAGDQLHYLTTQVGGWVWERGVGERGGVRGGSGETERRKHTQERARTHTDARARPRAHTHTHARTRTHTRTITHARTCTHTQNLGTDSDGRPDLAAPPVTQLLDDFPARPALLGYTDRYIDRQIDDNWMDGWMDGCMDGCMDGWMYGWMDGWIPGGRYPVTQLLAGVPARPALLGSPSPTASSLARPAFTTRY
jgi:hypothetical protein